MWRVQEKKNYQWKRPNIEGYCDKEHDIGSEKVLEFESFSEKKNKIFSERDQGTEGSRGKTKVPKVAEKNDYYRIWDFQWHKNKILGVLVKKTGISRIPEKNALKL